MAKVKAGDNQPLQSVVLARNIDPLLFRFLAERRRDYPGISARGDLPARLSRRGSSRPTSSGSPGRSPPSRSRTTASRATRGDETDRRRRHRAAVRVGAQGRCPARSVVEVDAAGEPQGREYVSSRSPVPGRDVRLSIDSDTQRALEAALAEAARVTGATGAAGVALDPKHRRGAGPRLVPDLLARDLRHAQGEGDRRRSSTTPTSRSTTGRSPASTRPGRPSSRSPRRRPCGKGIITPDTELESPSSIVLYKQRFQNFEENSHGFITLPYALRVSSDTYFYQVADRLYRGPEREEQHLPAPDGGPRLRPGRRHRHRPAGRGRRPTSPTRRGRRRPTRVPTTPTSSAAGSPATPSSSGVGQGFLQVTPLQMAVAYGAIADGGTLRTPTVGMRGAGTPTAAWCRSSPRGGPPASSTSAPADLDAIKQGLYDAANGELGTSTSVFGNLPEGVKVAGKTGTAEPGDGGEDHSWFVGYAPYDDPSIVVSIVIERGGTGANAAAPAVCSTMAAYLEFDARPVRRSRWRADDHHARRPRARRSGAADRVRSAVFGLDWILLLAVAAISAVQHLRGGRGHRGRRPPARASTSTARSSSSSVGAVLMVLAHAPQPRPPRALGLGPVGQPARRARGGVRGGQRGQGLEPLDRHRPLQPAALRDRQGGDRDRARGHRDRAHGRRRHRRASRSSSPPWPPSRRRSCSCSPTSAPRWSTGRCWRRSCSWWACPGRTSPWPDRSWRS